MLTFTYNKKIVTVPGDLEELSPELYIKYLELVLMLNMGTISPYEMKCSLLSRLLGFKADFTLYKKSIVEELLPQIDKLNSFFNINEEHEAIIYDPHIKTGKNLLPQYDKWSGPQDMLSDITYSQFVTCLNLLVSIGYAHDSNDETEIQELMMEIGKTLYSHSEFEHEAKTPLLLNFHAFYLFSSVWEIIKKVPIPINGKNIDFSILFNDSDCKNKPDDNTGWSGISYELAASGVFGDINSVKNANMWDVLLYLYKCRFEQLHTKNQSNDYIK